jgi:glucosamine--fructose-6-phosphate aminotransferase (isomerizing)
MCGIVGYVGKRQASSLLVEGLRRLEYRGYDSAGLCILREHDLLLRKCSGRVDRLAELLEREPAEGLAGISHTRWATHGAPTDANAHPHLDQSGKIAVVHNGVIENYSQLRQKLIEAGHTFKSQTDTEVLAHLIGAHYELQKAKGGVGYILTQAVTSALKEVVGTYGIAVISSDHPDMMVGARRGSPLIVGIGENENFLSSDVNAIVAHTRQVIYLNDHDVVTIFADSYLHANIGSVSVKPQISHVEFSAEAAEKGGYEHYMLKEIFEQPTAIMNAVRGRIDQENAMPHFGGLNMSLADLRDIDQVVISACGTSWHAGLVGEYLIEELARIPTEVEYSSEFRYRNSPIDKNTLILAITQSGETLDTLAGLREAKRRGHKVLSICNVVGSTIARESDGGIYLHAGPEIGVASTKAFTSQITVLTLLALLMGRVRSLSAVYAKEVLRALGQIPDQLGQILKESEQIRRIAERYSSARDFLFLGRGYNFPTALEGALKMKEISYIHAEGYPAAEMKHGPIALIEEETPVVLLVTRDPLYEKTMSNMEEIKARGGRVIAIASEGDNEVAKKADEVIYIPQTLELLQPLLAVVPLQLMAYHMAVIRGCDVDKPRNLAKSVTVE